ncbi:TIGR02679 family protein [Nocardia wallacei]|uniref:TIGR02679 family protein n=1 Tax=Nocardia wallacei TaxID=480035 RepID=UPI002453C999|nr:TIGR02679 family protein [Nocardia wallacei]
MTLPRTVRSYLDDPGLAEMWTRLRKRLERNGHTIEGSVKVQLDSAASDHLSGLLGRRIAPGLRSVPLQEIDAALLRSSAGRGLVAVVAELTGSRLRDRPSEQLAQRTAVAQLWAAVERSLDENGIEAEPWTRPWIQWLHSSGLLVRAGQRAGHEFDIATRALAAAMTVASQPRMLGELAAALTGDAHALDNDRLAGRLALRGLCFAFGLPDPVAPRDRIAAWERVDISVDTISSTVLAWGLRPPGSDPWSVMMRARADLGLVTHLTLAELSSTAAPLGAHGTTVAACENPQVLQRAAAAGAASPIVCFSGSHSSAGASLIERVRIRYHGDFDWPGIAIASRLFAAGAEPWRMAATDYVSAATTGIPRIPLTGREVPTPWDPVLASEMSRIGLAVHEESVIDDLLEDVV